MEGKKSSHFNFLIDKVMVKIAEWNSMYLSIMQKVILINSVLISMVSHLFSSLDVPISVCNKIDSMIIKFLWASKTGKGIHWVNKDVVHLPRGMGGLGIRSLRVLNQACLMKQVWRMHSNPQLLVSKVYNAKAPSAICLGRPSVSTNATFSWGMRGLRKADKLIVQGCAWKIGNGAKVLATSDKWVNGEVPKVKHGVNAQLISTMRVHDLICPPNSKWNSQLIKETFSFDDCLRIHSLEDPNLKEHDFLFWQGHKSGNISIKSAYVFLQLKGLQAAIGTKRENFFKFYNILWRMKILPKWKLFLWKLSFESLAVKSALAHRGVSMDD